MNVDQRSLARRWTLLIFLLALALRLPYILMTDNQTMGTWSDQGGDIALSMLEGRGYVTSYGPCENFRSFRMPVLPLTLFAIWSTVGYSLVAAKVFMATVSSVTCALIGLVALQIHGSRAAILAGLMAACFPNFIYWTGTVGPDTLTLFFIVVGIFFLGRGGSIRDDALAGACMGLLCLTRPVYIPYGLLLVGFVFRGAKERGAIRAAVSYALALALVVTPWVARNWHVHRAILATSTEGGMTFLECNNPRAFHENGGDWVAGYAGTLTEVREAARSLSEVRLDRLMFRMGLDNIVEEPAQFARSFLNRVWFLWRPIPRRGFSGAQSMLMGATWLPILALGLFGMGRAFYLGRGANVPIILLIVWTTLAAGLIRTGIRYRAPIEPFLIVYAASALTMWRRRSLSNS